MYKKVNIMIFAMRSALWLSVFHELKLLGFNIPYWIGANDIDCELEDCFFHEVIDAVELLNKYNVSSRFFDINKISLEEYYSYIKIIDRGDNIGGYSFSQRDRLFKEQLNYWFSVLKEIKPSLLVFSDTPHTFCDYPLYLVAKTMGIKMLVFSPTFVKGWHLVKSSIQTESSSLIKNPSAKSSYCREFSELVVKPYRGLGYTTPSYMVKQFEHDRKNKLLMFLKRLIRKVLVDLNMVKSERLVRSSWQHDVFDFFGIKSKGVGVNLIRRYLIYRFKLKLKSRYEEVAISAEKFNKIDSYVYVPLHYQPEATTAPLGGVFSDQIYMLEKLREYLPSNIAIVVKEHYSQFTGSLNGFRGRYLNYWDKINQLENTFIVPLTTESRELIVSSLAVATVTGTAGWEAIQYGKNCITFGEAWYNTYPSVIKYDDNFAENIKRVVNKIEPKDCLEEFLQSFCENLVSVDLVSISSEVAPRETNEIVKLISEYIKTEENNAQ